MSGPGAVEKDPARRLSLDTVRKIRRTRRHPRRTQYDYLQLVRLVSNLADRLAAMSGPLDVLDVFCGTRPYDELLPRESHCIGLDVDDQYGVADVVTQEFLPFDDGSFDLVLCTEGFHYVRDPVAGVAEIRRVLRPGGRVVMTLPLVWEYNRQRLEHRYTSSELVALFADWQEVEVIENGGFAVTWTTVSCRILRAVEQRVEKRIGRRWPMSALFALGYLTINSFGTLLDRAERRYPDSQFALPPNVMLCARRPTDD